jgi:MFS family permease
MHYIDTSSSDPSAPTPPGWRWTHDLTRYHWFVFTVAALGWLFDTLDQQLFNLARKPAMQDLLQGVDGTVSKELVNEYAGYATAIFLMGWATGGIAFGILGDRIGRAKTMMLTILVYSFFTGFSAFSHSFASFALFRFLTGLGVGGEFAVGVALVAEVMPARARPQALGLLQALSAVGNISAALIHIGLGQIDLTLWELFGQKLTAWRVMFIVGTLPALLAILIRRRLKEPERWQAVAHDGAVQKKLGSFSELFGDPRWRRNALVGVVLAFAGVVGLWGIGFFTPDLMGPVFRKHFEGTGLTGQPLEGKVSLWVGITFIMQNIGGFLGIYAFSRVTQFLGRRPTFAIFFVLAAISTGLTFWFLDDFSEVFWMIPLMGFCQLALFGGYAIYFPELFPTRLRSTGTSFCYNIGRFVAALGPFTLGLLSSRFFGEYLGKAEPMRYAGVTMCSIFLLGLFALPFAPETRGQPLPE